MHLPVLQENLYKPPQGIALDNIQSPPRQIRGDYIAIVHLIRILERNDKALLVMSLNIESGTADHHSDFFISADSDPLGNAWGLGKILFKVDELIAKPDILILVQLADHLGAEELRCLLHERMRPIQRIGQHHLNRNGGMRASELFKQRERNLLFAGICRVSFG